MANSFIQSRIAKFSELKAKYDALPQPAPAPIAVTLPDGKEISGVFTSASTGLDVAKHVIKNKKVYCKFIATLQTTPDAPKGCTLDMGTPLGRSCKVQFLTFEDPQGREVLWHSAAHLLGFALELEYAAQLGHGPATEAGFFYDSFVPAGHVFSPEDLKRVDARVAAIVKDAAAKPSGAPERAFTRLEVSKEDALALFAYSPLKSELIRDHVADGAACTLYRCADFVDFCRGPHVPDVAFVGAFQCLSSSAAYFKGDQARESMQRVYAVAFPTRPQLAEHIELLEEARRRDHRVIGKEMDLFLTHRYAPGAPFFMDNGTHLYRQLERFIRGLLHKYDYVEVMTPTFLNTDLWKTSGHLSHYKDNMFMIERQAGAGACADACANAGADADAAPVEGAPAEARGAPQYGLKPMNCPCHCLIYKSQHHSRQELPIRMAEFGVVHRNELSGALSGLTRVIKFEQDDAHIYCAADQIFGEITSLIDFVKEVYTPFGIGFTMALSLRPDDRIGSDALWDTAEDALRSVLVNSRIPFVENPGDGAFYGPKIDIHLRDAIGRQHQCGTIQLDFNLPSEERFDLRYSDYDEAQKRMVERHPVMIHRAILGSVERFMAVLIEHCAGKFPFWISPRQIMVVPVNETVYAYAREVQQAFKKGCRNYDFEAEVDLSGEKFEKKLALAWSRRYNFIMVVGNKEMETRSVALSGRSLANKLQLSEKEAAHARKVMGIDECKAYLCGLVDARDNI